MSIHGHCAAFAPVIDILVRKAAIHGIAEIAQYFVFNLTCDVIGEAEVNETWFISSNLPDLSNATLNLQIGPVVSEIRGKGKIAPPPQ